MESLKGPKSVTTVTEPMVMAVVRYVALNLGTFVKECPLDARKGQKTALTRQNFR